MKYLVSCIPVIIVEVKLYSANVCESFAYIVLIYDSSVCFRLSGEGNLAIALRGEYS